MRRGQSLVVWAIREGRQCAHADRQVPDGRDDAAALTRAQQSRSSAGRTRRSSGGRERCCSAAAPARGAAGAAPARRLRTGRPRRRRGGGGLPAPASTGIGSVVVRPPDRCRTAQSPRRGQAKSSARPAGGATASPLTSTRVADSRRRRVAGVAPPIRSCGRCTDAVSGTTGPASGARPARSACRRGRRLRLARRQRHRLGAAAPSRGGFRARR